MGSRWRDAKWAEMYFHKDLQKAAKYFAKELSEDLLSDALIRVFEKSDSELKQIKSMKDFVFMAMRNLAYSKSWWAKYNTEGVTDEIEIADEQQPDNSVEVTKEEVEYAEKIFRNVTPESVLLMRKLDEADQAKLTNYKLWKGAQYVKLYIDPDIGGSLRKVQNTTGIGYRQVSTGIKDFTSTLMDKKISVTYVTYGSEVRSGMELYRIHYPYAQGIATYHSDEFDVSRTTYQTMSETPVLESDIYVCSRIRFPELVDKIVDQGKKLVVDVDDYWTLHKNHPILHEAKAKKENEEYVTSVTYAMKKAHMVTVTTQTLANACWEELEVEATVIKNTIPEVSQFDGEKFPHSRVRIGFVGGNHHSPDLLPMYEGMRKLHSDPQLTGSYQIALAGFNTFTGTDGRVYANPHFNHYEKILTGDYHVVRADQEYKDYLMRLTPALDHIAYDKPYRRIWNKSVTTYGESYRQLDAVVAPLIDNKFNNCKSELKMIEAGMTHTALVCSDVLPFAPHIKHEENCLKVSSTRHDWYTQLRRIIKDNDLRKDIAEGLHEYVTENFNHKKEVNKLAKALKQLSK